MLFSFAADDRAALQFDDLASAFDAGLMPAQLGGDAAAGERIVQSILLRRGVRLSVTEDAVLAAAWRAGRIGDALRARAGERRRRAEFARQIWAGLRYPLLLGGVMVMAAIVVQVLPGMRYLLVVVLAGLAALAALAWFAHRGFARGADRWLRVPVLGSLAADLGEVPYLETLHALYAAGVPLLTAHPSAVAACPVAASRRRLQTADRVLQTGTSLTDALAQSLAVHPETRTLLAGGEQAGHLEDALRRALERRRTVAARNLASTARYVGVGAYALAAAAVIAFVFHFYRTLYAGLVR
jgi:type II secretory pathway component PulF